MQELIGHMIPFKEDLLVGASLMSESSLSSFQLSYQIKECACLWFSVQRKTALVNFIHFPFYFLCTKVAIIYSAAAASKMKNGSVFVVKILLSSDTNTSRYT